MDPPVLVPRSAVCGSQLPYGVWLDRYAYYLDSIWACVEAYVRRATGCEVQNQDEVRDRLEKYLYRTSLNRVRGFGVVK